MGNRRKVKKYKIIKLSGTWDDKIALAASVDSVNTTYEAGRSYLVPLRLSGQKKVYNKRR